MTPPLGSHESIAGGLAKALERGAEIGCDALQIFVKNASQWRAKPISAQQAEDWKEAHRAASIGPVVAHAAYLINLASTHEATRSKSNRALADELSRCHVLGLDGLVLHPGAHLGAGEEAGVARVARALARVLAALPPSTPRVLLENTAGQGTVLGSRLEQLAALRELTGEQSRIGFCIDTCHAFAAGYPIHTKRGLERFLADVDDILGLEAVGCFHINDSQKPLASHRDRHANIGTGEIGVAAFRRLMAEPAVAGIPMILETPLGEDHQGHARDLTLLRG